MFDSAGNRVEEAYFGIDGKPALIENGYARVTWARDERGNVIKTSKFAVDGSLLSVD